MKNNLSILAASLLIAVCAHAGQSAPSPLLLLEPGRPMTGDEFISENEIAYPDLSDSKQTAQAKDMIFTIVRAAGPKARLSIQTHSQADANMVNQWLHQAGYNWHGLTNAASYSPGHVPLNLMVRVVGGHAAADQN